MIQSLLNKISEIYTSDAILRHSLGLDFNLVRVLRKSHEEVGLHSAMITGLLNDSWNEGPGLHFSELVRIIRSRRVVGTPTDESALLDLILAEPSRWTAKAEVKTREGRIDIVCTDASNRHCLIIENKVWAKDQECQLERYYRYGSERYARRFCLIYLTLDGKEPGVFTLGNLDRQKVICMDYHTILDWLGVCERHADRKVRVLESIRQYREVIGDVLGVRMSEDSEKKVIDTLANKENLLASSIIHHNHTKALVLANWRLVDRLFQDGRFSAKEIEVGDYCFSKNPDRKQFDLIIDGESRVQIRALYDDSSDAIWIDVFVVPSSKNVGKNVRKFYEEIKCDEDSRDYFSNEGKKPGFSVGVTLKSSVEVLAEMTKDQEAGFVSRFWDFFEDNEAVLLRGIAALY